jgi:hypothetical protein
MEAANSVDDDYIGLFDLIHVENKEILTLNMDQYTHAQKRRHPGE